PLPAGVCWQACSMGLMGGTRRLWAWGRSLSPSARSSPPSFPRGAGQKWTPSLRCDTNDGHCVLDDVTASTLPSLSFGRVRQERGLLARTECGQGWPRSQGFASETEELQQQAGILLTLVGFRP